MARINRGRFTLSANIILTALVITRGFSFGFIMLAFYIKYGDAILDGDVIKIADMEYAAGMPLGTAVKSIVFSFIGVFVLELITGVCGMLGVLRHSKIMLSITVIMNSLMIVIYGIYIVVLSIMYNKKYYLDMLETYTDAYEKGYGYISNTYYYNVFPNFKDKMACRGLVTSVSGQKVYDCRDAYAKRYSTYVEAYFGLVVICIVCQIVSIIAVEYTYRKLEFKEKSTNSKKKLYLLLSFQYGIFRNFVIFIKKQWKRSKLIFISALLKITSVFLAVGLLGIGLTLIGDVIIYDYTFRNIFYRIQFYNYYFYDILVGIAASSVVIGILTIINAIVGLCGSWRKSSALIMTSTVTSLVLTIPRIVAFLLWVVFMAKINKDMKLQLSLLQDGYYLNDYSSGITPYWNHLLLSLHCCGVDNYFDTINSTYGYMFCCENAHESRLDVSGSFTNSSTELSSFGYCGEKKTLTCSESILFKTRMYIGWFLTMLFLQTCLEAGTVLVTNQEYSFIFSIEKSRKTILFRKMLKGIKTLLINAWRRSKDTFTSTGLILILNIGLFGLAIHIRYDSIFGNIEIQDLFSQIKSENISIKSTTEYFSIVAVTFSIISILASLYSTIIVTVKVYEKWRYPLTISNLCLWCVLVIASIVQLGLMARVTANITTALEEKLPMYIDRYQSSQESAKDDWSNSFSLNTLFIKAQCCGTGLFERRMFSGSTWYNSYRDSNYQHIPVQCCKSQTVVYPYGRQSDTDCTDSLMPDSYNTQGCDTAIRNHFEKYSITFMVFTSIIILAEICLIIKNAQGLISSRRVSTTEQQLVGTNETAQTSFISTSNSDRKHSNEKISNTGQTSHTKNVSSVNEVESLNVANTSREENVSNSKSLQPTVSLGNDTDGNQENMREQDKKINEDKNEATNAEQDDAADSKGIPDDGNQNALGEEMELRKNKKGTNIPDEDSTSLSIDD